MSTIAAYALIVYTALGAIVAVGFVARGVTRVLPAHTPVTPGARLLFLPGAFLLWPYVLVRWLASGAKS